MVDSDGKPGGLGTPDPCEGLPDDSLAPFSNFGPAIDIAAPGVCVPSTYPEPAAVAVDSGTSFAARFVSGAAALLRARHAAMTPQQVKQAIINNRDQSPITGD